MIFPDVKALLMSVTVNCYLHVYISDASSPTPQITEYISSSCMALQIKIGEMLNLMTLP